MSYSPQYLDYLQSTTWKQRRYAALERVNFKCELCGEINNLEVHHLTYAHLGNESPDELMVICGGHHWIEHSGLKDYQPTTPPKVKPILCKHVLRWLRKAKEIKARPYLTRGSKERLFELEDKYQDHIKRCQVCKIPMAKDSHAH